VKSSGPTTALPADLELSFTSLVARVCGISFSSSFLLLHLLLLFLALHSRHVLPRLLSSSTDPRGLLQAARRPGTRATVGIAVDRRRRRPTAHKTHHAAHDSDDRTHARTYAHARTHTKVATDIDGRVYALLIRHTYTHAYGRRRREGDEAAGSAKRIGRRTHARQPAAPRPSLLSSTVA
jgi:hypothetical protein